MRVKLIVHEGLCHTQWNIMPQHKSSRDAELKLIRGVELLADWTEELKQSSQLGRRTLF